LAVVGERYHAFFFQATKPSELCAVRLGIAEEVAAFIQVHDREGIVRHMPDEWVDAFSAAGAPEQVAEAIQRWIVAGADSVVFQPLDGDPACLDEYSRYLMPLLKRAERA